MEPASLITLTGAVYGQRRADLNRSFSKNVEIVWGDRRCWLACESGHYKEVRHNCMAAISTKRRIMKTDEALRRYQ